MVIGRLLSYWEGNFSGAMLNFGGVDSSFWIPSFRIFKVVPYKADSAELNEGMVTTVWMQKDPYMYIYIYMCIPPREVTYPIIGHGTIIFKRNPLPAGRYIRYIGNYVRIQLKNHANLPSAELKRLNLKSFPMLQNPQTMNLGGGFKYFLFSPRTLGKIPSLTFIFFNWVGSTTKLGILEERCHLKLQPRRSWIRPLSFLAHSFSHAGHGKLFFNSTTSWNPWKKPVRKRLTMRFWVEESSNLVVYPKGSWNNLALFFQNNGMKYPPKTNGWNPNMEVCLPCFSYLIARGDFQVPAVKFRGNRFYDFGKE